jgi:hypothetical protein
MTKRRGKSIAGFPLEIEIIGIICMHMITKKYTLAALENCS